ncbi:hypothetical protein WA158_006156 [Blastocystis sp. Blastoise]
MASLAFSALVQLGLLCIIGSFFFLVIKKYESTLQIVVFNQSKKSVEKKIAEAVTGNKFVMKKIREYHQPMFTKSLVPEKKAVNASESCKFWSVVTTINAPTTLIKQLSGLYPKICTVVVGDKKSRGDDEYVPLHVTFLSYEKQVQINTQFVKHTPPNHFSRKNIGFIYAITRGAEKILDIDDDNELINLDKFDVLLKQENFTNYLEMADYHFVDNTYLPFSDPNTIVWPRGFPLEEIIPGYEQQSKKKYNIVQSSPRVIQYLQQVNPDFDAIYRLTNTLPFNFKVDKEDKCVILKKNSFCPFNAQSTLFYKDAFPLMLLPKTVHGRVSDIWRSYFIETILYSKNQTVSFCSPLVNHIRNQHNIIRDFDAEQPLYMKSYELLQFLSKFQLKSINILEKIEELYITMYEYGIIELEDIEYLIYWIKEIAPYL